MNNINIFILNDTHIPEYHVSIVPDIQVDFQKQLDDLVYKYELTIKELGLKTKHLVFTKIFVCDYINQKPIIEGHPKFGHVYKDSVVSVIEQAPLDGSKINLLLYFLESDDIVIKKTGDTSFVSVGSYEHIYQSITTYSDSVSSPLAQTKDAFLRHTNLLSNNGLSLRDNCVRTWLYSRDVDKDYAGIVDGRNNIFDEQGLTIDTHFIASTGIEGKGLELASSVNIDFYSIKGISDKQVQYLQALDYLNNTYDYGVAFERGTCISYFDKKHIFISGTASIDKVGDCIYKNDVLKQVERIFLNIDMLLKDADAELSDIAQMIVYLRNVSDYEIIRNYLDNNYSKTPKVIVLARVCRPEWLIEIECIASKAIKS